MRTELGEELRDGRLAAGLSQGSVAAAIGVSPSEVGRIERGEAPWVSLQVLAAFAATLGLAVRVGTYPSGGGLRDAAHRALIDALRLRLHPRIRLRTEVPLPLPGDLRAWDAMLDGLGEPIGLEAETRIRDGQQLERRIALKQRDGGIGRVVLLVADTERNRRTVREGGATLRETFPVGGNEALRALAEGRDPGGSALVFLRIPQRARPQSREPWRPAPVRGRITAPRSD